MSIFRHQYVHVAPTWKQFYADGLPLKYYGWLRFQWLFNPVTQAVSIPFCTTLDLQLSFYRPLCYNSRAVIAVEHNYCSLYVLQVLY